MIQYPKLNAGTKARQKLELFKGLNRSLRIGSGEFSEMENLTSDDYPVLSPRGKRGWVTRLKYGSSGMFYVPEKGLFYLENIGGQSVLYLLSLEGVSTEVTRLNPNPKKFVLMGKTLVIVPDLYWVDIDSLASGKIAQSLEIRTGVIHVSLCLADGTPLENGAYGPDSPEDPQKYTHWVDTSTHPAQVKRYSAAQQSWIVLGTVYVCLKGEGLKNHPFQEGDGIHISGIGTSSGGTVQKEALEINGCHTVCRRLTSDSLIITAIMSASYVHPCETSPVRIERKVPQMDFLVECGNRLWGCKGNTNEIYACKLGDFYNWNCFQGLSTDSWVGSVGTPGTFTGAVVQNGYPVFYKENGKYKVWPSATGAHQITFTPCDGVQEGCENSLVVWEGTVFYRSVAGVCADDGGGPVEIGQCLGDLECESAAGAVFGKKYYLALTGKSGCHDLFVYDFGKRLWHREDDAPIGQLIGGGGSLYASIGADIWDLAGNTGTPEEEVCWMAVTGDLGLELPEQKYISRLTLRLQLEPGATLEIYAQYDREQEWVKLGQVYGTDLRSFSLPVRPRRCDQLRLKLQGTGMCKLYSITKTLERGSEQP